LSTEPTQPDLDALIAQAQGRVVPMKKPIGQNDHRYWTQAPGAGPATQPPGAERDFQLAGDDHYVMTFGDIVRLEIDHLRRGRNSAVIGELTVWCAVQGAHVIGERGLLSSADINLSSFDARLKRAQYLAKLANTKNLFNWIGLIEDFCRRVLKSDRDRHQVAAEVRIADAPSVFDYADAEIRYIRRPELPTGSVSLFTGLPESGKSSLVYSFLRDAWVQKGIPFLVLDRDNPPSIIADRLRRLGMGDIPRDCPWRKLRGDWGDGLPRAPQPDSQVVLDWIGECLAADNPGPIIFADSMGNFLEGGSENDAHVVNEYFGRCKRAAGRGATVISAHNPGKDPEQFYRGSSAIHDRIDVAYHITNTSTTGLLGRLTLTCWKHRPGIRHEVRYDYDGGRMTRDEGPRPLSQAEKAHEKAHETLTSILRTHPGILKGKFLELAQEAGLRRDPSDKWLDDSVLNGTVLRESGKRDKKHFLEPQQQGSFDGE
jgi:hypothetical protein